MTISPAARRGMSRCTVCASHFRIELEAELARGLSKREAAEKFKPLKADAILRHWTNHVSPETKEALKVALYRPGIKIEEIVEKDGAGLLVRLESLRAKLLWHIDSASGAGDHRSVSSLSGQLLKLEELAARANGDLVKHMTRKVDVNVTHTSEWQAVMGMILAALRPHDAAFAAVLEVMHRAEAADRAKMLEGPTIEGEVIRDESRIDVP